MLCQQASRCNDHHDMARRSGDTDEAGYWDAIAGNDEDEGSHLFWVPAHLHPEIAPSEFRAFLKEHARAADEGESNGSDSASSSSEGAFTEHTPFPGPARALSSGGIGRKKSMLSRPYRPSADDTDDEPQPVRRSRSSIYGGPQLTIDDLQRIDELAQDADPAKLRAVLRRSLSLNVAPSCECSDPCTLWLLTAYSSGQGRRAAGQHRRGRLSHHRAPSRTDPTSCCTHQDPQTESARRRRWPPLCIDAPGYPLDIGLGSRARGRGPF